MKKFWISILLLPLFLFFAVPAFSQNDADKMFIEGAKLFDKLGTKPQSEMEVTDLIKYFSFMAYVSGYGECGNQIYFDVTDVDAGTACTVVARWTMNNPDKWKEGRGYLTFRSLVAAFPMKKDDNAKPEDKNKKEKSSGPEQNTGTSPTRKIFNQARALVPLLPEMESAHYSVSNDRVRNP